MGGERKGGAGGRVGKGGEGRKDCVMAVGGMYAPDYWKMFVCLF